MAKPRPAPEWATPPLDIHRAAEALGMSRSSLDYALKDPTVEAGTHFELRGNRKVFYRENITAVRKVLTQCASKSNGEKVGRMPTVRVQTGKGSENLSLLKTFAGRKNSGRS